MQPGGKISLPLPGSWDAAHDDPDVVKAPVKTGMVWEVRVLGEVRGSARLASSYASTNSEGRGEALAEGRTGAVLISEITLWERRPCTTVGKAT
jgi:hypothetical protein